MIRVRIITLTPTSGGHFICQLPLHPFSSLTHTSRWAALLMQGILGFALSVLNPQFWHPTDSTTRRCTIISCSLVESSIQQTAWTRGANSRAHLGPVFDLIVVSGRVAEQSARHPSLSLSFGFGLILLSKPTMLPCC